MGRDIINSATVLAVISTWQALQIFAYFQNNEKQPALFAIKYLNEIVLFVTQQDACIYGHVDTNVAKLQK